MPQQANKMDSHVQIVAILSLVWGALAVAASGLMMSFFTTFAGLPMMGPMGGFETGMMGIIFLVILAMAGLAIATGVGLLKHLAWARTTGFVVAALSLFSFPVGTAIGVYTFWVLTRPETVDLLEDRRAAPHA